MKRSDQSRGRKEMPIFRYQAITQEGINRQGKLTAVNQDSVVSMLREQNYFPVHIKEVTGEIHIHEYMDRFRKVGPRELGIFLRQFYTMLNAGVSIVNALAMLKSEVEHVKLKQAVTQIYERVQKGSSLSDAMKLFKGVFPELLINMIEVGEVAGNVENILERMTIHFEKEAKMNNKVKNAMIYPSIVAAAAMGAVIFLLTRVLPTFVKMFDQADVQLPSTTHFVMGVSTSLCKYGYIFAGICGILGYFFNKWRSSSNGKWVIDSYVLKVPIVKDTVKKIITVRFARTLSLMLSNGVPLIQALDIAAKIVGNQYVMEEVLQAKEEVRKGDSLSRAIRAINFFPRMVDSMMKIGEESGALDKMMAKTADFYEEEVDLALQRASTMIEPLMILIMGAVIGFIVVAMVMPMFDMFNTIQ